MNLTPRQTSQPERPFVRLALRTWPLATGLTLILGLTTLARANEPAPAKPATASRKLTPPEPAVPAASAGSAAKTVADEVRDAVQSKTPNQKQLTLVFDGKDKKLIALAVRAPAAAPLQQAAGSLPNPADSRNAIRARTAVVTGLGGESTGGAAHTAGEVPWLYEGAAGPQAWGQLRPAFNVCAIGKRQSPIHIEESATLQGPAEPLVFNYQPSNGTVVNNGHTIQVDLIGDNSVTVRDSTFKLLQFHFHHPSEERVNDKGFSMVAHLVHKNPEGQLAVVAILLDPGAANALIDKVWTHMPLDAGDRVRVPSGLINMNELLPKDQRYYQFMGSLTTPPCSEGVLWMVLKQPTTVSPSQIKLFSQLFPHNARPVQAVNGRAVRNAQ